MGDRTRSPRSFCEGGEPRRCQGGERHHHRCHRGCARCCLSPCRGSPILTEFSGQFFDVLHLLSLTGEPSKDHILLMNGDLVDRGSWSVEVILTAFALKCF